VILDAAIVAIARLNQLSTLALVVLFSGAAWVLFISLINALVHPRSRLGASASVGGFHACLHGKFCLGKCSLGRGRPASQRSVGSILFWSWDNWERHACPVPLPDSHADLSPWNHWRMPLIVKEVSGELLAGPVLVTIEYNVIAEQESTFLKAMRQYSRVRRRDGAYQWGIYRDIEVANRFVKIFLVHSWAEHLRQHERQTKADCELEEQVYSYVEAEPKVRHLLYVDSTKM